MIIYENMQNQTKTSTYKLFLSSKLWDIISDISKTFVSRSRRAPSDEPLGNAIGVNTA